MERTAPLRTPTSAAPLKRIHQPENKTMKWTSPHSHECGSVEARYHLRRQDATLDPLRTPTSAAPLKRSLRASRHERLCSSPHSHECGSVEACLALQRPTLRIAALRTPTSAAPLKLIAHAVAVPFQLSLSALPRVRLR